MHPQIHCLDTSNSLVCEARDLTYLFLQEGERWGPSFMLPRYAECLKDAVELMETDTQNILGCYYPGELYDRQELIDKGLTIFGASEHTWRLLLKQTALKYGSY